MIIHNPENISLGSDIWIFAYSVLTAGPRKEASHVFGASQKVHNQSTRSGGASLVIGNEVQIGLYNVLNATAGLSIGDRVTLSARVSIYSSTHIANDPDDPGRRVGANGMTKSIPVFSKARVISIGEGAWLGLNVSVVCASIGAHCFVKSGSIVSKDQPMNSVVAGQPAVVLGERYSVND
ncbi:acyltransferase [bacterium AH-315-P15]|nr:acyltransferase [bacterium AH-315-P15]